MGSWQVTGKLLARLHARKGVNDMKASAMFLLYVLALLSMLASCRQVKYVPVETVQRDSIYLQQVRRDSIVRYDSVYVRDRGDTVTVVKYRYLYRDRWRTDTLYVNRTDTVSVPYPVEKPLTRWEQAKMEAGGVAIVAAVGLAMFVVAWLALKMKKK